MHVGDMRVGARQPLYPPYAIGQNYRILNMQLPEYNLLVQYIGADPERPNFHRFQAVNGEGYITIRGSSTYNPLPPPPENLYVTGVGNAGGRRKLRSRKSKRKTRRAHRKSRRHH
jgi:hypothetical protein